MIRVKDLKKQMPKKMYRYLASQTDPYFTTLDQAIEKLEDVIRHDHKIKMAHIVLEELKNIKG